MWRSSKQVLACLIIGIVVVLCIIALTVWAFISALEEKSFVPNQTFRRASNESKITKGNRESAERRGFILQQTSHDSDGVRIFAMVNTGRPVPISQRQLEKERNQPHEPLSAPFKDLSTTSKIATSVEESREVTQLLPNLNLTETEDSLSSLFRQTELNSAESAIQLHKESTKSPIRTDKDDENIPNLFDAFSQVFEADLVQIKPYSSGKKNGLKSNYTDWLALGYLGTSIFLLKQMDLLLQIHPEPVSSRALKSETIEAKNSQPWTYNSLNLLFVEPSNRTDVKSIIRNNGPVRFVNLKEYLWAVHNIYTASQQDQNIECIWAAYCAEINNRAPLQGITGTLARMNGVIMEIISGWLSPPAAFGKLTRSIFEWDQIDCTSLFPACSPERAAEYLIHLATSPVSLE